MHELETFFVGKLKFRSRLILGTGKYSSLELMKDCHEQAEAAMVTVAMQKIPRESIIKGQVNILDFIDQSKIELLPNTSGAFKAAEVLRMAKIVSAMGINQIKIEIMAESKTLFPDPIETVKAVEMIREDSSLANLHLFIYCSDDPILSLKLFEAGADCIMPAGSAIGSGRGLANPANLKMIRNLLPKGFPLIIDAGIGTASDAAMAMELGYDAVLLNSAIALARDPLQMAEAMKLAVIAGRRAYLSGRIPEKLYATATSPQTGISK